MIGDMIAKAREGKGVARAEVARRVKMNFGHLTHIEKGTRFPSIKALRSICASIGISYHPLLHTLDRKVTDEQKEYNIFNHISYDRIPAVDIKDFIPAPPELTNAAIAIKVPDDSMEPRFPKDSYVFIEYNAPLDNRDYGIFFYNGQFLIRKFIIRKDCLIFRAENEDIIPRDICVSEKDNFYIVGKIIGAKKQ